MIAIMVGDLQLALAPFGLEKSATLGRADYHTSAARTPLSRYLHEAPQVREVKDAFAPRAPKLVGSGHATGGSMGGAHRNRTLYERVGGQQAIMAAVGVFYEKVLADELTRPFFAALDLDAQIKKQIAFMTWAFGGPAEHKGRDLRTAHANLVRTQGLNDVHFDAVARHLEATLRELGLADDLVSEALQIIASTRTEVLGR